MGKPEVSISKIVFIDLYVNQKKSGLEIARFFGIGRTTVGRYIERYGLEPRNISEVRKNKHWSPSDEQRRKLSELGKRQVGSNNPTWKGGKSKNKEGYIVVRVDNKYVKEHRLVMESHLGRLLKSDEHIHHIDGNRENNNLNNLRVVSNSEHLRIEWTEERRKAHSLRIKKLRSERNWSTKRR